MTFLIVTWAAMVTLAIVCGGQGSLGMSLSLWAGVVVAACLLGALLLHLQPIGRSTPIGRIGGGVVHWGYRIGNGRLLRAVAVSWLVWMIVGSAVIGIVRHRTQTLHILMILTWLLDSLALLHILGVLIMHRRPGGRLPPQLLSVVAVMSGMLVGSLALWAFVPWAAARYAALAIAGAPPLLVGGGYGVFLGVMMTVGRKARWN